MIVLNRRSIKNKKMALTLTSYIDKYVDFLVVGCEQVDILNAVKRDKLLKLT